MEYQKIHNFGGVLSILDSSLITETLKSKIYDFKVVQCGSYIQIYEFEKNKVKRLNKDDNLDLELKKIKFDDTSIKKKELNLKTSNEIETKNIVRSKLQCQRIAKSNMKDWKSFITLTFKDNINDVNFANKRLHSFVVMVKRVYKDFKYLCVPEFQKRGAIHYHLLTNLECGSEIIPKREQKKLWNKETQSYKELNYYDIKYWNNGFSSAEPIIEEPKKVIGYISKYITKEIDNRLFSHRRFFYSQNCVVPKVSYIDSMDNEQLKWLQNKIRDKELIYQDEYINSYDNTKVTFLELQ